MPMSVASAFVFVMDLRHDQRIDDQSADARAGAMRWLEADGRANLNDVGRRIAADVKNLQGALCRPYRQGFVGHQHAQ